MGAILNENIILSFSKMKFVNLVIKQEKQSSEE